MSIYIKHHYSDAFNGMKHDTVIKSRLFELSLNNDVLSAPAAKR